MIRNNSNSAKSIKEFYNLSSSDNWTVEKQTMFCAYDGASVVQDEYILDKYFSYFKEYTHKVTLDQKYFYNPQLFAKDYYGDAALDFLVMYFAKCTSNYEFNKTEIDVLDYEKLTDLNKLFTFYKKTVENNKNDPPVYYAADIENVQKSVKLFQ